jgi:hypothetical protein
MKKIILGAILLFSVMSCTKEEDINEIPVESNIKKITDGSVKEGYLGTIKGARIVNKTMSWGADIIETGTDSKITLIYISNDVMFLDFSAWGKPVGNTGEPYWLEKPTYTQGSHLVTKIENGKIYFWDYHIFQKDWVKCEHVLDLSSAKDNGNGTVNCFMGGINGSGTRIGQHIHNLQNNNEYVLDIDTTSPPDEEKPIYKNIDSFVFKFSEIVTYKNGVEYSVQKTPITVSYDAKLGTVIYSRQGSFGVNDIITYNYHVLKEVDGSLFVEDDVFTVDHFMRLKISSSKIEVFEMSNESIQVSEFKDWELR